MSILDEHVIPNLQFIDTGEVNYDHYKYTKLFTGIIQNFINNYWEGVQDTGLGLAQIDDLFILLILLRFIILAIRYNFITSFIITLISVAAGYVWYSNFISALSTYENAFYKYSFTYRLGMDISQLRRILQTKVQKDGYQIRLSNPIGIIIYALTNGSIHNEHRIDFISMSVTKIPVDYSLTIPIPFIGKVHLTKYSLESGYYYTVRKIIPQVLRLFLKCYDQFIGFGFYTYMTRVNKRYCPYLLRWHWTMTIVVSFFQTYFLFVSQRMSLYTKMVILPILEESQRMHFSMPYREFEFLMLTHASFTIVLCQIGFQLFSMYHAVCGQYYYIPMITENTEMHVGKRDTTNIYSGGYTAWQNPEEKSNSILPKVWYGWLGKGTKTPNFFIYIIKWFIFRPIYRSIRKLLRFGRKRKKR